MGWGGYDGYTAYRDRTPRYECRNCKLRLIPPLPKSCPQCGRVWTMTQPLEHAPKRYREDQRNRVGWTPPSPHQSRQ